MNRSPASWWSLLWLLNVASFTSVESHHILGLFVNVHRSQLMVHLAVCQALIQKGHQLTLVTTLPLEDHDIRGNVTHILIPWEQPRDESDFLSSQDFFLRLERMFSRLEKSGDLLNQPEWKAFLESDKNPHFDLMILGYHFNDHLLGVAAHFKCPVAIITTQQATGFVNSLMGNPEERWYVPQPYDSQQRSGISAWIFGIWEKLMEILARRVMKKIYSLNFPKPQYPNFETMRRSVALTLSNHHSVSEGPIAPVLPNMLDIGGIVLEQQIYRNYPEISFTNRSIIVFSLGSRFTWRKSPQSLVSTFTKAFSLFSDYDIYWTYDGVNQSAISLDYPYIKISKWWPQSELLASGKVKLFITHGGKGSISEALYYGVPMLGLPLIGDQRANLLKMQSKKWGLTLQTYNLTHIELHRFMNKILSKSEYLKSISKSSKLYRDRPMNSSDLATFWLEYIIRHKGAKNLYYPSRELNWLEYQSFDVYVIIYGFLILIVLILQKINRLL
ncbi:hypothetical protein KR054_004172 [Drosophila jambulina]|nr:hypothetical protein KR054_004172 [Drosophila jambulina]